MIGVDGGNGVKIKKKITRGIKDRGDDIRKDTFALYKYEYIHM